MRSYRQYCAVAKALDVVGDRWTLLIVRELLLRGGCRFTDLQRELPGIATNLLSERLKELEQHAIVTREAAAPPVATTLYHLTDTGRDLEPVVRALLRWGVRFMPNPTGDEAFRSHWLTFPVSELLRDSEPDGPPASIEVRTNDQPAVIEIADGEVTSRVGVATSPDLVLEGDAPTILGVLTGMLGMTEAHQFGLRSEGSAVVLSRLQYRDPAQSAAERGIARHVSHVHRPEEV
ncbi:winged helix-turn-helix transcriptional regulator [Hoyosella altamirensis]|uniref:DNA-binding HxlR family transcriptional regulator n=1 Tax=Hoyosella altamirensis TaxID=616997 RepID=A0A839RPU2_9ACTN|nr:helix-turn-helix domain-containing protein [Hoyosella altamirensis]MBB3037911.1 DNA-binding HxlR family transcriptional regulator [Hoyosella altamirensis]